MSRSDDAEGSEVVYEAKCMYIDRVYCDDVDSFLVSMLFDGVYLMRRMVIYILGSLVGTCASADYGKIKQCPRVHASSGCGNQGGDKLASWQLG